MNPCASIDGEEVVLATGTLGKFVGATGDTVVHGTYRDSGTWAPELLRLLLEDLLGKGGTLIDIGANIGLVAIPVTEDSSVRTFAFEPDPRNAELLRRNVALHDLENRISVNESALWSRSGEMTLQRDRENHGDQRLVHAPTTGIPSVTVPLARLDTLVEADALESPVVAKIDTQGAEVDVLQGAGALLSRIDAAIVEVWPSGLARVGRKLDELETLLASEFSHARLLLDDQPLWPLVPIAEEFERLAAVPTLAAEETFFDILVSRHPEPLSR